MDTKGSVIMSLASILHMAKANQYKRDLSHFVVTTSGAVSRYRYSNLTNMCLSDHCHQIEAINKNFSDQYQYSNMDANRA